MNHVVDFRSTNMILTDPSFRVQEFIHKRPEGFCKDPQRLIYGFFGVFRFLSNFELCQVRYDGRIFNSTEAAYMSAKVDPSSPKSDAYKDALASPSLKPSDARKLGRQLTELRDGWDDMRLQVMYEVNLSKYQDNPHLREKLLATEDLELVEANWWNDTFWGECNGIGENNLGKTLMRIRDELRLVYSTES